MIQRRFKYFLLVSSLKIKTFFNFQETEKNGTNGTAPIEKVEAIEPVKKAEDSSFFQFSKRSKKKGGLSMEQDAIRRFGMAQQAADFTNEDMKLSPWTDISRKLYRVCTVLFRTIFTEKSI